MTVQLWATKCHDFSVHLIFGKLAASENRIYWAIVTLQQKRIPQNLMLYMMAM